jgi:hypothetical protein
MILVSKLKNETTKFKEKTRDLRVKSHFKKNQLHSFGESNA